MATTWRPDQTFYPSPRQAMQAPPEKLVTATDDPTRSQNRLTSAAVRDANMLS
jgi:hypothetical protein